MIYVYQILQGRCPLLWISDKPLKCINSLRQSILHPANAARVFIMSSPGLDFEIWRWTVPLFKEFTFYWVKQISKQIWGWSESSFRILHKITWKTKKNFCPTQILPLAFDKYLCKVLQQYITWQERGIGAVHSWRRQHLNWNLKI